MAGRLCAPEKRIQVPYVCHKRWDQGPMAAPFIPVNRDRPVSDTHPAPGPNLATMKTTLLSLAAAIALLMAFNSCQTTGTQTSATPTAEDRFAMADKNHDGKLSPDEASDYFVSMIFASCDHNQDGKLTWEEWNVPGSGRTRAKFNAADTNHDGFLTLDEALAYGRKRQAFKKEFDEADTNHDGFVTLEEAKAYYAGKEGPPR